MPQYYMQTNKLLLLVCNEIERMCKSFIKANRKDRRGIHLVAWNELCQLKQYGGIGLRKIKENNKAYLMKLV